MLARTTTLMQFLPKRGPRAFPVFVDELRRDHSWLADCIEKEREVKVVTHQSIEKRLVAVMNAKLLPMVYGRNNNISYCTDKDANILTTLSNLLEMLESQCHAALKTSQKQASEPLHVIIEQQHAFIRRKKEEDKNSSEMANELKDLKKQIKKLEKDNKKIAEDIKAKNLKLKDQNVVNKEMRRYKMEIEKYKREIENLKNDLNDMRQNALDGPSISTMY